MSPEPDKDTPQLDKDVTELDKDLTQLDKDMAQLKNDVTKPSDGGTTPDNGGTTPDKPKDESLKAIEDQELTDCKKVLREKRKSLLLFEDLLWRRTVEVQTHRSNVDKLYFDMYQAEEARFFRKRVWSRTMIAVVSWIVLVGAYVIVYFEGGGIPPTISLPLVVLLLAFFWGVAIIVGFVWASQSDLWKEGESKEVAWEAKEKQKDCKELIERRAREQMYQISEFLNNEEKKFAKELDRLKEQEDRLKEHKK